MPARLLRFFITQAGWDYPVAGPLHLDCNTAVVAGLAFIGRDFSQTVRRRKGPGYFLILSFLDKPAFLIVLSLPFSYPPFGGPSIVWVL